MQEIRFEYFHGLEAGQYSFYRVPKLLFTAECFKCLSCEAKVLYGLMLDRMGLSLRNRWFDNEDRVYIIFRVEEIAELMGCGTQKAVKLLKELDTENGIGLIEKRRLGLGKPNVIYVKNFILKEEFGLSEKEGNPAGQKPGGCLAAGGRETDTRGTLPGTNGAGAPAEFADQDGGSIRETDKNVQPGVYSETEVNSETEDKTGFGETAAASCKEGESRGRENGNCRIVKITNQECQGSDSRNVDQADIGMQKEEAQFIYGQECQGKQGKNVGAEGREGQALCTSSFQNDENHNSGMVKTTTQEFPKSKSIKTDQNNTEGNKTGVLSDHFVNPVCVGVSDAVKEMEKYRDLIRRNVSYECFQEGRYCQKEEIDELVELIVDVMMMPDTAVLRIAGVDKPVAVVKSRFMKLEHSHIEYVTGCLQRNTTKVGNIKSYLLTALYNAVMTMDNYYRAEVNHDLYGG